MNFSGEDLLTAVVRASFDTRFIQTGIDPQGNAMGYHQASPMQPFANAISDAIKTDTEFKAAFLAALLERVDIIADKVAETIAKSVIHTDSSFGRTTTQVAPWAKEALAACLADAFQPAVAAHVQERLTYLDLSQMDVNVVASVSPKS